MIYFIPLGSSQFHKYISYKYNFNKSVKNITYFQIYAFTSQAVKIRLQPELKQGLN